MNRRSGVAGQPLFISLTVLLAIVTAGFVAVGLTWRGVAGSQLAVPQVAFIVSGGFGGVALIGFGLGVASIQLRRWTEAKRRAEFDLVLRAMEDLLVVARDRVRVGR